jgi:NAD(P)-dependent dehydrogenase (short-subunit alcohol dehydrogenase family)
MDSQDTNITTQKHGRIFPLPGDVTKLDSMRHCAEYIRAREGYINVLITSAGKMIPKQFTDVTGFDSVEKWSEYFLSIPMEDFTSTMNLNVSAAFYTAMTFLPLLDAGNKDLTYKPSSQVISMGSVGGYFRRMGAAIGYGASKAAVRQVALACATQFAPFNIRFNIIALGGYRSEFTEQHHFFQKTNPRAEEDGAVPTSFNPTGHAGREYNCAGVVLYLTSPAGDYCNGSIMLADGGQMSQVPATW